MHFNSVPIILIVRKCKKHWVLLGVGDSSQMPKPIQLVFAQLAFANSDIAFQGNHLFQGNFYGVSIYDISNPANTKLMTSIVCPGGQGDVSVYKNLMFMSVEMPNGRLDCSVKGFPVHARACCGSKRINRTRRKIVFAESEFSIFPTSAIRNRSVQFKPVAVRTRIL